MLEFSLRLQEGSEFLLHIRVHEEGLREEERGGEGGMKEVKERHFERTEDGQDSKDSSCSLAHAFDK